MSGFAGVIRLDGRPADAADGVRMLAAIAHRNPAGEAWIDDVTLLSASHADAEIVVAADLRLDEGGAADVADAYRRWGVDCAAHLEGDFAFALFDRRTRTLVCSRDAFGVKPLVYAHVPGKLFAFASEAQALLALADVPRTIDEKRLTDFLDVRFEDPDRTFYSAIKRLPGGCTLILRDGAMRVTRWWSAEAIPPAPRATDAEYAEGFREHLVRAVRVRMRVADTRQLGAFLSGGLDSSSIACVARNELPHPLPVFSWIFSDVPEADEREYQELVAASGGMTRHVIDSATSGFSPWSDLDRLLRNGPPYTATHYLNHGVASRARAVGIRTLLDGLGGDSSISRGGARFVELCLQGRFVTLVRELRAYTAQNGGSVSRLFVSHVLSPLMPSFALRAYRAVLGRPPRTQPRRSTRADHIADLQSPLLGDGMELFDRVMTLAGVEGRYPFFDRRLVEYCVALPGDQKLAGGYSRIVARRAMNGILPDTIRWRASKGRPALHTIWAVKRARAELDEAILRDPSPLASYADVDRIRSVYQAFVTSERPDASTAMRVWSAAVAVLWLRQAD